MKINRYFIILAFVNLLSPAIMANPDVFFADSARFGGAYLTHELEGNNIKFKMTEPVGVAMPERSYDLDALVAFTSNEYRFTNARLKPEFQRMFEESFESEFGMMAFLNELVLLLNNFRR